MNRARKTFAGAYALMLLAMLLSSCDKYNYTDELQSLGARVTILESLVNQKNTEIAALATVVRNVEENGFVTSVSQKEEGVYVIEFNNQETVTIHDGKKGRDGQDGKDGKEAELLISVGKASDGIYYWTVNGEWILDGDGNKIPASPNDGKDGKDGKDGVYIPGQNAIIPQLRIDETTRNWEISTDNGQTWQDTGVLADGKDGRDGTDGKDGKDGEPDLFAGIIVADDGQSLTFLLLDGQTFTVPIVNE